MSTTIVKSGFAICLLFCAQVAKAQSNAPSFEQRLAALEQRVEMLERENAELRQQVARALPEESERKLARPKEGPAPAQLAAFPVTALPPAAVAIATGPAQAAVPPTPPKTSAEQKWSDRFEVGGQIRFRGEVRQNADQNGSQHDAQDYVLQRVRFHVRTKLGNNVETFVQFQDSRLWGQEASTASNDNLVDLHQAYVHVNDFLGKGIYARAGRQEFSYGTERLIGAFGWDNIGRSFDALKMGYSSKNLQSDWFAAKLVDRNLQANPLRLVPDRGQYLYGMYNQFFLQKPQHLEVYGLLYRDGMRSPGEIAAAGRKATELMTLGFHSDGTIKPGISYDVEFADQFGHRGFDSHSARAFAGKFYKTLEEKHQLRLGFEYDIATGDSNSTDGRSGEFFNLFPTNHPHYGYADLMGWRNMQDFRPMLTFKPAAPVKFDFDYHRFYLLEERGPWKNAGGVVLGFDPTGQSGTHVGDEVDFTVAFPIQKHLNMLTGYSIFLPGDFAKQTRGSDNQHFFYLQTQVDF